MKLGEALRRQGTQLSVALLLIGMIVLPFVPSRLFGKSYVELTYVLRQGAVAEAHQDPLREAAKRVHASLRGRGDVEADRRSAALTVEIDERRREHTKRNLHAEVPEIELVAETPVLTTSMLAWSLPGLVSLAWLLFVRRFDRAHPEPWRALVLTFVAGLLTAWIAGSLQWLVARHLPFATEALRTLSRHGSVSSWSMGVVVAVLHAGLIEEALKVAAFALLVLRFDEFDEPVDGIVYAASLSLGFAAAENVRYFADGNLAPALVVGRSFLAVPAHVFIASVWGRAFGERLIRRGARFWPAFALAVLLHGLLDVLALGLRGSLSLLLPLVVLGLSTLFFHNLRSMLRFGPRPAPTADEVTLRLRTGSARRFWLALLGFNLVSLVMMLGSAFVQSHYPTKLFGLLTGATALLLLLALLGHWVTEALPLDVELDAHGLRYAGAAYAWRELTGEACELGEGVLCDTRRGAVYLGPLSSTARAELLAALRAAPG